MARVLGPLVVTEIYELWGTYVLFSVVTATLLVSLVLTIVSWRWLVPVQENSNDDNSRQEPRPGNGTDGGKQKVGTREPGRRVPGSHLPTFAEFEEEEKTE